VLLFAIAGAVIERSGRHSGRFCLINLCFSDRLPQLFLPSQPKIFVQKGGYVRGLLQTILAPSRRDRLDIQRTNAVRAELARLSDDELRKTAGTKELLELFAATAAIASRLLGQDIFDVQQSPELVL
jgi:hypothetical protein